MSHLNTITAKTLLMNANNLVSRVSSQQAFNIRNEIALYEQDEINIDRLLNVMRLANEFLSLEKLQLEQQKILGVA